MASLINFTNEFRQFLSLAHQAFSLLDSILKIIVSIFKTFST